jgi:hypothetical protein
VSDETMSQTIFVAQIELIKTATICEWRI